MLRPGTYYLREAINIQAPSDVHVEIETMELPTSSCPVITSPFEPEPAIRRRSSPSLRHILACRTVDVEDGEHEEVAPPDFPESAIRLNQTAGVPKKATLVLRTRRHNEPLFRVRQGRCSFRNLELRHISHGTGKILQSGRAPSTS